MSDSDAPTSRVSKPLLIVLGVLALAALAYVLLILLNQGDGADTVDQAQAPAGSEPAVVVPEAGDATEPGDGELPVAESTETAAGPSFEVFSARDPFDQLVADSEGGAVGETQDTTAPVDGTAPLPPAVPGDDTPDTDAPDPVTGGPAQTTVGVTTILLEEVFSDGGVDIALVRVDNEGYEAAEGDTVAGGLTVLDIEDNCATMRFEDRRFILCEGEQIQK